MNKSISHLARVALTAISTVMLDASIANGADAPATAPSSNAVPTAQPETTTRARVARNANNPGERGNIVGGFNLDEKQRELLREATQKENDEVRRLNEKLQAAQKELVHAVVAEKYHEKLVREKAEAVSKIQTDITMLRAKAFATVSPTLKPEQREQLENSQIAIGIIMGGAGGRAGFAGPGGPGAGGFRNAPDGQPGERGVRRRDAGNSSPGASTEPSRRRAPGQDQ